MEDVKDIRIIFEGDPERLKAASKESVQALGQVDAATRQLTQTQSKYAAVADQAIDRARNLNAGLAPAPRNVQAVEDAYRKLDDELGRFLSQTDKVYQAQRRLDAGQDVLNRSLKAGLISQETYTRSLANLQTKFGPVAAGMNDMAVSAGVSMRSVRSLVDELAGGRQQQAMGTLAYMAQRFLAINPAAAGALLGVAAFDGTLLALVVHAESVDRSMNRMVAAMAGVGNAGMLTRAQIRGAVDEIDRLPGVSHLAAEQTVTAFLSVGAVGHQLFDRLVKIVGAYAYVSGMEVPKAGERLAQAFADPGKGAKTLDDQLNILTADQVLLIQQMERQNDIVGAQGVLMDALTARLQGLEKNGLTPLQAAFNSLGNSIKETWRALSDSKAIDSVRDKLAEKVSLLSDFVRGLKDLPNAVRQIGYAYGSAGGADDMAQRDRLRQQIAANASPTTTVAAAAVAVPGKSEADERAAALDRETKSALATAAAYETTARKVAELTEKSTGLRNTLVKMDLAGQVGTPAYTRIQDAIKAIEEQKAKMLEQKSKPGDQLIEQSRKALAAAQAEAANGTDHLTAAQKKLAEVLESDAFKKAAPRIQAETKANYERAAAVERATLAEKALAAEHEKDLKYVESKGEALERLANSWDEETARLELEVKTLGLSNLEREKAILLIKRNQDILAAGNSREAIRDINAEYEKQVALLQRRDGFNAQKEYWNDWAIMVRDAMNDAGGTVKRFFKDLANLAMQKLVLNVGASVTGNAGLAQQATSAGQNTVVGGLYNAGMNYLGSTAIGGGLMSAVGGFSSGLYTGMTGTFIQGMGATAVGSSTGIGAVAGSAGSLGSTIGTAIASIPVWGWIAAAILAVAYAVRDKGENWKAKLAFGDNVEKGGYSRQGVFGTEGFAYLEGDDTNNKKLMAWMDQFDAIDKRLAKMFDESQMARIRTNLQNAPQVEKAFPKGDGTVAEQLQREYLNKYAVIFDEKNKAFADRIRSWTGKAEDLMKEIDTVVTAYETLDTAMKMIKATMGELQGGTDALRAQLADLRGSVDTAKERMADALSGTDIAAVAQAEQNLITAVMNRYNTEMSAIKALQEGLTNLRQSAYEFRMQNAQRINSYGGNINVAGIAYSHLTDLRGQLGNGTAEERMNRAGTFLSTLDSWVSAKQAEAEAAATAAEQSHAAISQAQQAAIESQITGLQQQLELSQAWKGVLDSAQQAIDRMRLSGSNPLGGLSRLALSGDDVTAMLAQYRGATGQARIDLANQLMQAVGTRQGLAEQQLQRPDDAYLDIYNQNMAIYSEIRDDAKSNADKQVEIQARIETLQRQSNSIQAASFDKAGYIAGLMADTYSQARSLATEAQEQYDKAASEQEKLLKDQLDAITGGMDVNLYTAKLQKEMLDTLSSIDVQITNFLNGLGPSAAGTSGSGGGTSTTSPGNGTGGGNETVQPVDPSSQGNLTINVQVDKGSLARVVVPMIDGRIDANAPAIAQRLAQAS